MYVICVRLSVTNSCICSYYMFFWYVNIGDIQYNLIPCSVVSACVNLTPQSFLMKYSPIVCSRILQNCCKR